MVERGGGPGLGLEPAQERLVVGERRVQHLDRDATAQAHVLGEEDMGGRAGADRGQQAVPTTEHAADLIHEAGQGHEPRLPARCRAPGDAHDPCGG